VPDEPYKPEAAGEAEPSPAPRRIERIFAPVLAGMLLDSADLLTFGPFRIMFGMLLGAAVALYLCHLYGLSWRWRIVGALVAGIYCTLPFTGFLPLATLLGLFIRFRTTAKD